jgi:hypothetical protein
MSDAGRTGRVLVLAAALAGVGVACGNKTDIRPPELVQPKAPTSLLARSTSGGVVLTWRRPGEYTGGGRMNDLGGFDVERAPAEGPSDFVRVGRIELDDQTRFRPQREITWTDATASPGARYRYRVIAFTLDGYESAAAGPVQIEFDPGAAPPAQGPAR